MLVKNLNGTADNKAPYGYISWLDFWEKKSGKKAHECAHCRAKATVGAHVQKASIEVADGLSYLCVKNATKSLQRMFLPFMKNWLRFAINTDFL